MRKFLLLMLVSILVLGVIGCNKIDPGVQTDEKIQGAWQTGDYSLYISAAQMSVKYITDVVTPYRTEFSYTNLASGSNRYSNAANTQIRGELLLFDYKANTEIATVPLTLDIAADPTQNTLTVGQVTYSEPEYYYAYAMPKEGVYKNLYSAGDNDDTINAQQPSITIQPSDSFWNVFTTTGINLTVGASVSDSGDLSYQWYSNASASNTGGIAITIGGTSATLSIAKASYATNGARYFYVVVTNTNNNVEGNKTATATSNVATVTVVGNTETGYTTSAMPAGLKGTWQFLSDWGLEEFVINDTTFTSSFGGFVSYAGTIKEHRSSGTAGYITIEYTENSSYTDAPGKFYVIHYKDLTATTISISAAYLGADPDFETSGSGGKATQTEAEATFTVSSGYYAFYSDLNLYVSTGNSFPSPIQGTWTGGMSETFIITDETITYSMGTPVFTANIVKVIELETAGYIIFEYTSNYWDTNLVGCFCALYWENYNAITGKADIAVAGEDTGGDIGEGTQAGAEAEYIVADPADDDYYTYWIDEFTRG